MSFRDAAGIKALERIKA